MKRRVFLILAIVMFRLLIDWIYINEIVPLFDYANFSDFSSNESYMFSWGYLAFFIPFVLWISGEKTNIFSQLVASFILFMRIIPFSSLMMYMPQGGDYIISNLVYWGILLILLNKMEKQNPFNMLNNNIVEENYIRLITFVAAATVFIVSGVYCHFRIHLSLDDVYDLRMEAREFNMPKILAYLQAATSNVIPILIIYFITKKKKSYIFLLAFIGLLNFSIAGHKSTLFKIILCLGLYYFPNINYKKALPYLLISFCIASIVEFISIDSTLLSTMIVRRGFYVPAKLDISYYNYIVQRGPTYFQEGIAYKLGALSGNDAKMCNNGMFSDAFMNLGYLGCLVFPFVFAYFVKVVEFITENLPDNTKLFAAFIIVFTLISSYFTTSMLTHGLFLLCLTLYYMPKKMDYTITT